jgi:hypothetical protein
VVGGQNKSSNFARLAETHQTGRMRDGFGVLLVAVGLGWTLLARGDRIGLLITLAGVTLLAYGVFMPHRSGSGDGREHLIF